MIPLILFIIPFAIKSYPNITLLISATQSTDSLIAITTGSVCIASIILTVYLISYIEYYLIRRNIQWIEYFNTDFIPKALTIGAIFVASLALTYISFQVIKGSDIEKEYQSALQSIPNSLTTHFPAKTNDFQIEFEENSPIKAITTVEKGENAVQKCIETLMQTKVLRIYEASDSSLILIEKDKKTRDEIDSINKNGINYYPIYYDSSLFQHQSKSDSSESIIPEDFKIYIIDAQPGLYSDKAPDSKLSFLPKAWENGYSRGVYLSEKQKIAIYWLAIW